MGEINLKSKFNNNTKVNKLVHNVDLRSNRPWLVEGAYVRITSRSTGLSSTNAYGKWRESNNNVMWNTDNRFNQVYRVWRGVYAQRRYRNRKWFTLRPINSMGQYSQSLWVGLNPSGNPKRRSGHLLSLQKKSFW